MPPISQTSHIELVLLASLQIWQPCDKLSLKEKSAELISDLEITDEQYEKYFLKLSRSEFLWRTGDNKYIVTPKGRTAVGKILSRLEIDKLRFWSLKEVRKLNKFT